MTMEALKKLRRFSCAKSCTEKVETLGMLCDDFSRCDDCAEARARAAGALLDEVEKRLMPEDTQERIDEDAGKTPCQYFGWVGVACTKNGGCPAREMVGSCELVKIKDLLRRQRELDAKGAGRC